MVRIAKLREGGQESILNQGRQNLPAHSSQPKHYGAAGKGDAARNINLRAKGVKKDASKKRCRRGQASNGRLMSPVLSPAIRCRFQTSGVLLPQSLGKIWGWRLGAARTVPYEMEGFAPENSSRWKNNLRAIRDGQGCAVCRRSEGFRLV